MIFNNLKQRIRDRREQKLRVRLFIYFGGKLLREDLKRMTTFYNLMLDIPPRYWDGIMRMMEKALHGWACLPPHLIDQEALFWVKKGELPEGFSWSRKNNPG